MLYVVYTANRKTFIYETPDIDKAEKILSKAWAYYGEIKDPNILATKPKIVNR